MKTLSTRALGEVASNGLVGKIKRITRSSLLLLITGLTHLDEVQGARKRKRKAYYRYGERLSDRRNEEIRQTRKSYKF